LNEPGAAEQFVNSPDFYKSGMNGLHMQRQSYLGRYLSFSALTHETRSWREGSFNQNFRKMREEQHQRVMDEVSKRFYALHTSLSEVVKKLMKNTNCKEKLLKWMRHAVDLNLDKRKMHVTKPVASDGFILNYIDLLL